MNASTIAPRLAVCSWSLRPTSPTDLLESLQTIGLSRVQIALDPVRDQPDVWASLPDDCARVGIQLVSGMFGTIGEDYTTLETIKRTGGVVPDSTWADNWRQIQVAAALAERLGLKLVTFHAGFLPHDNADPAFARLLERLTRIAELFAGRGIDLGFETGQESASTLKSFLQTLNQPNVGVNFDPANMLLYDKGDPIAALRELGPWLKQCHLKDAFKTRVPGTWGQEVPVGSGQVDWRAFFHTAAEVGFAGDFAIEREAGDQRVADIRTARRYVEQF